MKKHTLTYILYFLGWVVIGLILPHCHLPWWGILATLIIAYLPMWVIASKVPDSLPAEIWGNAPPSRRGRRASVTVIAIGAFIGIQMGREQHLSPVLAPYFAERWYAVIACFLASIVYFYIRGFRMTPEDFIDPDEEEV